MALKEDDLPILNDVVRSGDESIIQSTRLERVGIDRLDSDSTAPLHFELPAHLQLDTQAYDIDLDETLELDEHGTAYFDKLLANQNDEHDSFWREPAESHGLLSTRHPVDSKENTGPENLVDNQLELLIDEIIDKHIVTLRTDLRNLLLRARKLP
ncbi:MAG: hypothetical protein AB8B79_09650 [Granulosicoccus sp.]